MPNVPITALHGVFPGRAVKPAEAAGPEAANDLDAVGFDALLSSQLALAANTKGEQLDLAGLAEAGKGLDPAMTQEGTDAAGAAASGVAPDAAASTDLAALLASMVRGAMNQPAQQAGATADRQNPMVEGKVSVAHPVFAARTLSVSVNANLADPARSGDVNAPEHSLEVASLVADKVAVRPAEIAVSGKELPPFAAKAGETTLKGAELGIEHLASQDVATGNIVRADITPGVTMQINPTHNTVTIAVEPRVGAPGWDGALGQKVVWLANQHQQTADLQLNPPHLGPLEVKLNISHDQASAVFVSHHAAVREAIEAALPRLREMLADSGITLGNVQVSAESFPHGQPNGSDVAPEQRSDSFTPLAEGGEERGGVMHLPTRGLVDIFA